LFLAFWCLNKGGVVHSGGQSLYNLMKKELYKFLRPYSAPWGIKISHTHIWERICVPPEEFSSQAEANKYCRWVMGHQCIAVKFDENELREHKAIIEKFSKSYV